MIGLLTSPMQPRSTVVVMASGDSFTVLKAAKVLPDYDALVARVDNLLVAKHVCFPYERGASAVEFAALNNLLDLLFAAQGLTVAWCTRTIQIYFGEFKVPTRLLHFPLSFFG